MSAIAEIAMDARKREEDRLKKQGEAFWQRYYERQAKEKGQVERSKPVPKPTAKAKPLESKRDYHSGMKDFFLNGYNILARCLADAEDIARDLGQCSEKAVECRRDNSCLKEFQEYQLLF